MKYLLFGIIILFVLTSAILNGKDSDIQSFQFTIMSFGHNKFSFGGGILISELHVLSIGTLIQGYTMWILGYGSNIYKRLNQIVCFNGILHPNYNDGNDNIGIIILPKKLENTIIRPINLPNDYTVLLPNENDEGMIIGFGDDGINNIIPSPVLQLTYFMVTSNSICTEYYPYLKNSFCATDTYNNSNVCIGDLGNPFIINHRGVQILIGLTTIVLNSCLNNSIITFINVQSYLPWIKACINK